MTVNFEIYVARGCSLRRYESNGRRICQNNNGMVKVVVDAYRCFHPKIDVKDVETSRISMPLLISVLWLVPPQSAKMISKTRESPPTSS